MFSLKICRDGMITLRIEALERKGVDSNALGSTEASSAFGFVHRKGSTGNKPVYRMLAGTERLAATLGVTS